MAIIIVSVKINGEEFHDVESFGGPNKDANYWRIKLKNNDMIYASGNVIVRFNEAREK